MENDRRRSIIVKMYWGREAIMIRVIVADDEYKVCQLICQLIKWEEFGMELVGTASNGIEALQMIEVERPDLVLTDIRMPGCDGLELLKKARLYKPDMEFIIISGYSHFEYARTAIQYGVSDYILKPINKEALNDTLSKVQQRYIQHKQQAESSRVEKEKQKEDKARLRDMLWMDIESGTVPRDMRQINLKYHYEFSKGFFQVFVIQVDVCENRDLNLLYTEHVFDLLHSKVMLFFKKMVAPLCQEAETFYRRGQVIGVLNYPPARQQEIREALISFGSTLSMELQVFEYLQLHISMSQTAEVITALSECFDGADRAMGQRLLRQENTLFEEIPADTEFDKEALYKSFSIAMRQSLDIQSADKITEAVSRLEKDAIAFKLNGSQMLQLVKDCYRLFLLSSIFQNEYNFADKDELEAEFNKKAMLCSNARFLFAFLCENCQKNLEDAQTWSDKEKNRPIAQAQQYIKEHYMEPLSLDEVSSQVGFSTSYFSTLFRRQTEKTFLEYLMDVRIDQAKNLLRETRMTMEAVCREVGCNDYKRFSKTFKKATGVSPKEYRNLYS